MVAEVGQRMDALCREAGHALGQRPEHTGDAVEILPVRSVSTEPSTRGVDSKLAKRIQAQPDTLVPTRADTRTKDLQAKSERIPKNPPIPLVIEPLPPELARRIKERVDDRAWTAATGSHTEASYAEYLERHPKGAHIVEATKRLKWIKLKANLLWLAVYGPVAMFAGVMLRLVWNWLRA